MVDEGIGKRLQELEAKTETLERPKPKYQQKNDLEETIYKGKGAFPKRGTITQTATQYRKDFGYTFPKDLGLRDSVRRSLDVIKLEQRQKSKTKQTHQTTTSCWKCSTSHHRITISNAWIC
eukprot:TRINITY_DN834_c3_g1_i2.p1 TRINITY_DN834_c3_g1~~TRINITY_DN834_c3_g1_i2.p1  ORF type:complete len:121 (+),score=23.86 TRINITY_DN834_c3_g1_i2:233-595(+)